MGGAERGVRICPEAAEVTGRGLTLDPIDVDLRSRSRFFRISALTRSQGNPTECGFWCKVRLDPWNVSCWMTQTRLSVSRARSWSQLRLIQPK